MLMEAGTSWSMALDRILISDLSARCIIGVWEEERREKQDVLINVELFTDLSQEGKSDRFEDAVDYRDIKKRIMTAVENSQFHLIEALAEVIAKLCLENPRVRKTLVRVEKPSALRFTRTVGVEILRER